MSFEDFVKKVSEFAEKAGAEFSCSASDGKYIAHFDDESNVSISGNSISGVLTVMYGAGHMSVISA